MTLLDQLQQQLGPLTYPLLLCSLLTAVIVLERIAALAWVSVQRQLPRAGRALLAAHREHPPALREELLAFWLKEQQQRLGSGIRLLHILGIVAPLLGLLGTVIGLIQVFDTLGQHQGPIEPALLAEGLGIAMKTTAAGLLIAVPAIIGAHGFRIWVDQLIRHCERQLNRDSFALAGINTEVLP